MLTATIQDAAGNTVTSDNTSVVTFAKDSGAGTVTGTGTDTAVAGIATKTVTGALVGAIVLDANSGALTEGTIGFTVVHGAATQITLTESGSTTAGDTHTLTATLEDVNGNTVTTDNATVVTFAKTGGAGTVTGLGSATAAAGVATQVRHEPARRPDRPRRAGRGAHDRGDELHDRHRARQRLHVDRRCGAVERPEQRHATRRRSPSRCSTPAATRCRARRSRSTTRARPP